jgi:short-subunit dehydrogenase
MQLTGRRALLTGATGGLGGAIARALAGRGATLLLSSRKQADLERLAQQLPGSGHRALPADLAEPGAAERLAVDAGEVDVLVANAGLPGAGWLTDFSPDEVTRALRVNLEAPMLLAQALYPGMVERGGGHLVFISSLAGKAASPRTSIYNATKFGLRGFALALRSDLGRKGVGVSLVSPGFIRDAGMFHDSGAKTPPGLGTATSTEVGAAVVKAVEQDKVEIVVAPLVDRVAAHFSLISPGIAVRAQSGAAGQKASEAIATGHSENAKDKR